MQAPKREAIRLTSRGGAKGFGGGVPSLLFFQEANCGRSKSAKCRGEIPPSLAPSLAARPAHPVDVDKRSCEVEEEVEEAATPTKTDGLEEEEEEDAVVEEEERHPAMQGAIDSEEEERSSDSSSTLLLLLLSPCQHLLLLLRSQRVPVINYYSSEAGKSERRERDACGIRP